MFGGPLPVVPPENVSIDKATAPTQVVLVDWLQFLRKAFTERVSGTYKPRIGLVVAAWDLVPHDQKEEGPGAWVATNLPLLAQYVEANNDDFEFEYFGVSVASGDLKADEEFRRAYLNGDPRTAGEVVHSLSGAVKTSDDMTLPVAWALGLAGATGSGGKQEP